METLESDCEAVISALSENEIVVDLLPVKMDLVSGSDADCVDVRDTLRVFDPLDFVLVAAESE